MNLPANVSHSTKLRNPALYPSVGAVAAPQPQPASQALVKAAREPKRRAHGLDVVVTLIALRRRLFDDDNNVSSFKPLRDAIAESLGIDDGDQHLRWQYGQLETKGEQGVIVKIETA